MPLYLGIVLRFLLNWKKGSNDLDIIAPSKTNESIISTGENWFLKKNLLSPSTDDKYPK